MNGSLDPAAIEEGNEFFHNLPQLEPGQAINRVYLHWSVEPYGSDDRAYNATISLHGVQWVAVLDTDPRLNATHPPQEGYAAHTYMRNSNAFGIAVAAMLGASPSDFGQYPLQVHQLEVLCAAAAAVCLHYNIDATGANGQEHNVMTHAECALNDNYFPERWDLARFAPTQDPLSEQEARANGDQLRARIHAYKLALFGK